MITKEQHQQKVCRVQIRRANAMMMHKLKQIKEGAAGAHERVRFVRTPKGVKLHHKTACEVEGSCRYETTLLSYCADCRRMSHGVKTLARWKCKSLENGLEASMASKFK